MSLSKKIVLEELCLKSDQQTIQKLIQTDKNLDKAWELKHAFNRICSGCCLELIKAMDFDEIRVLDFDRKYKWENIPTEYTAYHETLPTRIPILYLAIYAEILDVVDHIVKTAPEELLVYYGDYSVFEFVFAEIYNDQLNNYFLNDDIFKKCARIIYRPDSEIGDSALLKAFKQVFNCPRKVVEKLLILIMECENQGDRYSKLKDVIKFILEKPEMKLQYLDMLLQKKNNLVDEVWSDHDFFITMLFEMDDIEFIEKMYANYHPNLLTIFKDGRTLFLSCLDYLCYCGEAKFFNLVKKLLEWEPKLAKIPNQSNGDTPLMLYSRYGNLEISSSSIEKYGLDINTLDFKGKSALYHATACLNFNMLFFLLENNARMDNLTMDQDCRIISYICAGDDIQERADDVMNEYLTLDIFCSTILCLVKVHGARIQNLGLLDNDILNDETLKKIPIKDFLDKFQKVYSTLINHQILDFNLFLRKSIKSQIETNEVKDSCTKAKLQMSLATAEIHFDEFNKLPHLYYDENGFKSVKEFISIKNFNSISRGREIPSLKHLCRNVIREEVFKNCPNQSPIDLFKNLEIPTDLKKYLCFLDYIPIDM